jgi:beta-glucanase (GH16 family)
MRTLRPAYAAAMAVALAACLKAGSPAAAATGPLTQTPDGKKLELAFADEFESWRPYRNGQGVWRTTFRDGKGSDDYDLRTLKWNKEVQLYVDPDFAPGGGPPLKLNPFALQNGTLSINFQQAPAEHAKRLRDFKYVSGLITTQPSFTQTYGYFEMRAKLPRGKGVWPAFWLLPADLSWPPEIDIMESVGDPSKVYVVYHSNAAKIEGREIAVSPDDFHTFGLSWTKDEIAWFVDGKEVRREKTPADMHKPMYMLANIASGGDWAGAPDASTPLPARLTIDYIRAYRFAR